MPPRFPIAQKVGTEPGYHHAESLSLPRYIPPRNSFRFRLSISPSSLSTNSLHCPQTFLARGKGPLPNSDLSNPILLGPIHSIPGRKPIFSSSLFPLPLRFLNRVPRSRKSPRFPYSLFKVPLPLPRILMRIQKSDGGRELFKRSDG